MSATTEEIGTEELTLPPTRRTILIYYQGVIHKYFISLPSMKFYFKYITENNIHFLYKSQIVFFLENGLEIHCILPNIRCTTNEICLKLNSRKYVSLDEMKRSVMETFWSQAFSSDWAFCMSYYKNLRVENIIEYFELWQEKTKADRNWIPGKDFFKEV
jgi:hypothetical protein